VAVSVASFGVPRTEPNRDVVHRCVTPLSLWPSHSSVWHFPAANALDPNRSSFALGLLQRLARTPVHRRSGRLRPSRPGRQPASPGQTAQAGCGLHTAPMPDPTVARSDVAEVAKGGCVDACLPAQRPGKFGNSLSLNDPPNIDRPNINRNLQSAMEVPRHQHLATKISP